MNSSSTSQHDDPAPPSLMPTAASAGGYFLVAIICALAGYAVGNKNAIPPLLVWRDLALLGAFLFPAYVNRAMLYEQASVAFLQGKNRRRWQRLHSWIIPLVVLLALVTMCGLAARSLLSDMCAWRGTIATVVPIYVFGAAATIRWPKGPRIYDFTFRSFFPALATCLPPFIFGFVGCNQWQTLLGTSVVVLLFWGLALALPTKRFARIGIVILIIVIASLIVVAVWYDTPAARWMQAVTFGILLTLVMGVAEAWRVTSRILHGKEFRPTPYSADELIYYRGGTNAATALFLPCFVVTAIHPATSRAYLWCVLSLLLVGYAAWFIDRKPAKSSRWPVFGVVFGLAVPIVISLCTHIGGSVGAASARDDSLTPIATIVTISSIFAVPISYFARTLQRRLRPGVILLGCLSARVCIAITGVTACAMVFLTGAFWIGTRVTIGTSSVAETRLSQVYIAYLVIIVLCLMYSLISWLTHLLKGSTGDDSQNRSGGRITRRATLLKHLWYAFQLTRPLPSLAAGLLAFAAAGSTEAGISAGLGAIAMTGITMFGFVVNDIFDEVKDRRANVQRPLSLGLISRSAAATLAVVLAGAVHAMAAQLSDVVMAATVALCTALVLYTAFARLLPGLKGLYTAILACAPLWYGHLISGRAIHLHSYVLLAAFVLGRELLMDVVEREDDWRAGMRTVPFILGVAWTARLGIMLVGGAAFGLLAISESRVAYVLAASTVAGLIYVALASSWPPSRRIAATRPLMILGALAVAIQL
ncbi:MAG TPA: UbiA family prenyltransferase [Thermoanaerobaculia bacterium]|nr:UbiA family prenyltransferase [Thermoanaerobaculia bacterium]